MGNKNCLKYINKSKTFKPIDEDKNQNLYAIQNLKLKEFQASNYYKLLNNVNYTLDLSDIFQNIKKKRKERNVGGIKRFTVINKVNVEKRRKRKSKFSNADYFSEEILKEINLARDDCEIFSDEVDDLSKKIINENNCYYLILKNESKVEIYKNKIAFRELSVYLRGYDEYLKDIYCALEDFEEIPELRIPFPEDENIDFMNDEYITKCQKDLANFVKGKYELIEFVFQVTVSDPKISNILTFIGEDDSSLKIRECLLSNKIKYVGINSKKIDSDYYGLYLVFAK